MHARRSAPLPRVAGHDHATEYSTYLRIDELLRLQQPLTPAAHDELLFIVVHQTYELWFKVILHELRAAIGHLNTQPHRAVAPLRRVTEVEALLIQQLHLLETMSPEGFLEFRDPLAPASGFQSTQFREIERLSGLGESPEPSLRDGLWQALNLTDADQETRLHALGDLYLNHGESPERTLLHQLCELLVEHDEELLTWRHRHMLMAAREIGAREGTGGSRGVAYLAGTLDMRCFPELWEVRNRL